MLAHTNFKTGWSINISQELSRLGIELPATLPGNFGEGPAGPLPDPADEHVLRCARAHRASFIVTYNFRDFPQRLTAPIRIVTPDQLLLEFFDEMAIREHWKSCEERGDWEAYCARLNRARLHKLSAKLRLHCPSQDPSSSSSR